MIAVDTNILVCLKHGATQLLTEDRDFARFRSLGVLSLAAFAGR